MIQDNVYEKFLMFLLNGDQRECSRIVSDLLNSGIDIKDLYINLFQRSQYRVGELWEENKISVAKEHLCTAIIERLLNLVYPKLFSSEKTGKKAVISCNVNEYHQIGGKMVADLFELHGWDGYFLGANTPIADLIKLIDEKQPDMVGVSLSLVSNLHLLHQSIETIRATYPQIDILVGGQAFRWGGADSLKKYPSVTYISDLHQLESFIAS